MGSCDGTRDKYGCWNAGILWAVEARRKGRGKEAEQRAEKEHGKQIVLQRGGTATGNSSADEQDAALRRSKQAEKVQVSSEVEMEGVGRTRPAAKAKEKVTEVKEKVEAEEDRAAKQHRGRQRVKMRRRNSGRTRGGWS